MVSFCCDVCQETIKKPKLDQHFYRCPHAVFTCIDCSTTFSGTEYRTHNQCISEAEKYQKSVYRPKGSKGKQVKQETKPEPVKENIVQEPKGAPLISQLKKTVESTTKDTSKKSKSPKDVLQKSIQSILKKNPSGLKMSELKEKAVKKTLKKCSDAKSQDVQSLFDSCNVVFENGSLKLSF